MKKSLFKGIAYAAALVALASCNKEKPQEKTDPQFPELQQVEIQAGNTENFTFTADADWTLVIDQTTWCKFLDKDVPTEQLSGKAGDVTFTVQVSDAGLDFESKTAKIDLTFGEQTKTIIEVTRPGLEREVEIYVSKGYNGEYEKVESIVMEYEKDEWGDVSLPYTKFTVKANFDWTVAAPEGIIFTDKDWNEVPALSGKAGVGPESNGFSFASVEISADRAYEKDFKLNICDSEGNNPIEFTLHYGGLHSELVLFEPENIVGAGMWNNGVKFSIAGKYIKTVGYEDEEETEEDTYSFSVKARDMKYAVHAIEIVDEQAVELGSEGWVKVSDDKQGQISVSVSENTGASRLAYLVVLPEALEKTFKAADYYVDGYVADVFGGFTVKVSQKGTSNASGFKVMWGQTMADVEVIPFSDYSDFGGGNASDVFYGSCDDNAYVVELTEQNIVSTMGLPQGSLQIFPLGFPDDYYPFAGSEESNLFSFFDYSDNWDASNINSASFFDYQTFKEIAGVSIDPNQFFTYSDDTATTKAFEGIGIFQFYASAADKMSYKSSATLIVVKK